MNTAVSVTQHGGFVVYLGHYGGTYPEFDSIEFDVQMPLLHKQRTERLWHACRQSHNVINAGVWHVPLQFHLMPNADANNNEQLKTILLRGCKFAQGQQSSLEGLGAAKRDVELLTTMGTMVRFGCHWYMRDLCVFLRQALHDTDISRYAETMMHLAGAHFSSVIATLTNSIQDEADARQYAKRAETSEAMLRRAYATLKDLGMSEEEINKTLAPQAPNAGTSSDQEFSKT